jgi:hypothetical protein
MVAAYFADCGTTIPPIITTTFILRSVTVKEFETADITYLHEAYTMTHPLA